MKYPLTSTLSKTHGDSWKGEYFYFIALGQTYSAQPKTMNNFVVFKKIIQNF